MAAATAVRPGVTIWQLDPTHSSVEFAVKHMMMTTVRGRFRNQAIETGGVLVANKVRIEGEVQFVRQEG
jgi:polyisoprenoid-binding protein YceI